MQSKASNQKYQYLFYENNRKASRREAFLFIQVQLKGWVQRCHNIHNRAEKLFYMR